MLEEGARPEHRLDRQIERDVEQLVGALRFQPLEEAEIVLDMLEHVDRHQHVEALLALGQQVAEAEGQPVLRFVAAELEGLRRDLVAIELLVASRGCRTGP